MRLVLGYRYSRYIDLSNRANATAVLSPFDYTHIVLEDVVAHPEILANMSVGEGDWVLQRPCENPVAIAKDNIICGATGFSHTRFGVAVKKSVGGYIATSQKFSWSCEDVKHASVHGAFVVACYDGKYTNIALASFNGLFYVEAVYRRRPVSASIGYRLATVTFVDGRSVVVAYPGRVVEVGMPVEAIALTPREEILAFSKNTIIEASHEEIRPLVVVGEKPVFRGFFFTLPALQIANTLYALDGGSLVKKIDVKGDATAWNIAVDDASTDLAVYNPSLKLDMVTRKEPEARCWATSEGVVCCRNSWCGVVEPGETVVEIEPLSEVHGFAVRSDTYVKLHSNDLGVYVVKDVAKVIDEKTSLLRGRRYAIAVEHLLGYTDIVLESPAKLVKVEVGRAVIETSAGIHECGAFGHGLIEVRVVEKPARVKIFAGSTPVEETGTVEICANSVESVAIVAVDPVASDSIKLLEVKPEIRYIPTPRVDLKLKHFEGYSEAEVVKDSDAEVLEAKLCCYNTCSDLPKRIENCRLPAYIVVRAKRNGFIYSYRFDVAMPGLVNEAVDSVKGSKAKIVKVSRGGFIASGVLPEQPAIPPIHDIRVYIAPRSIALEFTSRALGRGLAVLGDGYIEGFILKHGRNSVELPFTDKLFIALQTNLRWVYGVELKPEQLLLAGKVHAELLAKALEKVLKA